MSPLYINNQIDFSIASGSHTPSSYIETWNGYIDKKYVLSSSAFATDAENILFFLRSQGVLIKDSFEVENFISRHSGLLSILQQVPRVVMENFGDTMMTLELFEDDEDVSDTKELFFIIDTKLPPSVADQKVSDIDRSWLLKNNDKDTHLFNIALNYL